MPLERQHPQSVLALGIKATQISFRGNLAPLGALGFLTRCTLALPLALDICCALMKFLWRSTRRVTFPGEIHHSMRRSDALISSDYDTAEGDNALPE